MKNNPPTFTIIQPSFTYLPPPEEGKYLEFLEICCRTCYLSQDKICEGSAEKLLTSVVKDKKHLSVVEHLGMILRISTKAGVYANDVLVQTLEHQPLFRFTVRDNDLIISGNIRMWIEFLEGIRVWSPLAIELAQKFNQKYPFFAIPPGAESSDAQIIQFTVSLLDENPLTNRDKLSLEDMGKHMTLTARVVCDRSCSHQLVRNRLCSYSQTSQRYVNYSKKGFQYVKDPEISSLPEELQFAWEEHVKCGFKLYAGLTREGKLKPEKARTLLANCTATEVITTTTINQWKLMFKQRGHNKAAESQIRDIMLSGEKQFQEILPDVFTS